ncbi:autotransporter domain-containing protein [Mesorhizobium terrae]
MTVDGAGSTWTNTGRLVVGGGPGLGASGTLTIQNGGTVTSVGGQIGELSTGHSGVVTVDGAGSTWTNTGDLAVGGWYNDTLNIRNGGVVNVSGAVLVAKLAVSTGALNIGSASGQTPVAPGTLNAASVTFGAGDGRIVFNHTGSNYVFAPVVSGPGQVLVEGGTTVLTGTNTYTGDTTISGGVLSVSSDSNLGAAASRVILDGGTLQATASFSTARAITTSSTTSGIDVAGANNLTLAGLVSGSGALTKSGTGMLTLTGANTYGGVTTISAGTLAIASTGGVTSDVNNNAALANAGTVAGSVANNAGATFTQTGGSVSGGVINAGTVIANGGALNGAIANNAGGSFNVGGTVAGNSTFTNANGATFAVAGGGNYALAGLLTNNGTATVAAGGALTANGGIFNAASGVITNNGTVTDDLNNAGVIINNATYNATVASNTGTIVNSAGATWNGNFSTAGIVGNAGTINGSLTQIAGTTTNNGAITSAVTVSGGLLTGAGSSGALTVANGATFQPGSGAAGTSATVSGMLAFQPGSTYAVNVNSVTASFAKVNGAATISGGTVQVLDAPGAYTMGTHYTIVTATSGRSGAFDGMTLANPASTPFLSFGLNYDPNNVYLDVSRSTVTFASVGQTPNQAATGGGLDSLPLTNPLIGALAQFDTTSARASYDRLSGEVHASAKAALIEDSRFVRDAMNDRLRSAFDGFGAVSAPVMSYASGDPEYGPANTERFAVWGRAFGSWGDTDDDGNAARLSRSTGGFFVGTDTLVFDTWRFGMLAGYSHTNFNVRDRNSSGISDNYHVGLYGGTEWGSLAFRTGAAYTWHDISTSRIVAFPGFSDSLKGKYNAGIAQAFGELAYGMRAGTIGFEPFANLAYVNLHTDGFNEVGGAAALTSNGGSTDATFTTLGLRASTIFMLGDVNATARGMFGIRHAFGDVTPLATMAFAGGAPFTIAGVPIAKNTAVAEASLDFAITPNTTLGISYSGQFGTRTTDQSVRGNLDVKF